jgi:hypothetical protein
VNILAIFTIPAAWVSQRLAGLDADRQAIDAPRLARNS